MQKMRSEDLLPVQLRVLRDTLRHKLRYLTKLRNRMEQRGFPEEDRLYRSVRISEELLSATVMEVESLMTRKGMHTEPCPFTEW